MRNKFGPGYLRGRASTAIGEKRFRCFAEKCRDLLLSSMISYRVCFWGLLVRRWLKLFRFCGRTNLMCIRAYDQNYTFGMYLTRFGLLNLVDDMLLKNSWRGWIVVRARWSPLG